MSQNSTTRTKGGVGEDVALAYLLEHGFTLVERNYSCKQGEIDLITKKDDFIVFVEVKSLDMDSDFYIYETLTKSKKRRLKKAINTWLLDKNKLMDVWRCDFVGILIDRVNGKHQVEHFEFIKL